MEITIGICDDNRIWLKQAERILEEYAEKREDEYTILLFQSGKELLQNDFSDAHPLDILFMDIQLEGENGIDVTKQVNEKWGTCQIVYLTDYINYAVDVYDTMHAYYVLKDQFESRLDAVFSKIFLTQKSDEEVLVFDTSSGMVQLKSDEIYYFERNLRQTKIVTDWGIYHTKLPLTDIKLKLPENRFSRCHNSFLVNLSKIVELRKESIHVKNGDVLGISRRYRNEIEEGFTNWVISQRL